MNYITDYCILYFKYINCTLNFINNNNEKQIFTCFNSIVLSLFN